MIHERLAERTERLRHNHWRNCLNTGGRDVFCVGVNALFISCIAMVVIMKRNSQIKIILETALEWLVAMVIALSFIFSAVFLSGVFLP